MCCMLFLKDHLIEEKDRKRGKFFFRSYLQTMSDWRSRITLEPGKLGGKPCVRGMRISVADVLEYLAADMSIAEILADFPYLEREDILACLAYAAERERERGVTPQPA
jgi:uncharacterized protein (DUF433 family)